MTQFFNYDTEQVPAVGILRHFADFFALKKSVAHSKAVRNRFYMGSTKSI